MFYKLFPTQSRSISSKMCPSQFSKIVIPSFPTFNSRVDLPNYLLVLIIWVCLKMVYLIFQWIITIFQWFPNKLLFVGIPYFQTNPYLLFFFCSRSCWRSSKRWVIYVVSLKKNIAQSKKKPGEPSSQTPRRASRGWRPWALRPAPRSRTCECAEPTSGWSADQLSASSGSGTDRGVCAEQFYDMVILDRDIILYYIILYYILYYIILYYIILYYIIYI